MLIERWKIPILIVSHDERDFKGLADSVICLKEGRITAWEETT
jgi:ABC-type molybdate transport system ATPase subunit